MRRIEYTRLEDIPPAARNPKAHDRGALILSIARFGFTEPALLDERTGRLVGGHGRLEAVAAIKAYRGGGGGALPLETLKPKAAERAAAEARASGAAAAMAAGLGAPAAVWEEFDRITGGVDPETAGEPDGITVDEEWEWYAPVVLGWSSASDDEAEALLVALNRLPEAGGWDAAGLADLLGDLPADLAEVAGYDEAAMAAVLAEVAALEPPPEPEPEPPAATPARVKRSVRSTSSESTTHETVTEPAAEIRPEPAEPYRQQWGLLVTCLDEEHQGRALAELQASGYRVEPVRS